MLETLQEKQGLFRNKRHAKREQRQEEEELSKTKECVRKMRDARAQERKRNENPLFQLCILSNFETIHAFGESCVNLQ